MKNLLKSVMLLLLTMSLIGCESEAIENVNDQSRESSISTANGPCENLQALAKFVNYGSYETDFKVYDSDGVILTSDLLIPDNSSDLKPISTIDKVTLVISNSGTSIRKTLDLKSCMLYTFVIDAENAFRMYKSEI